MLPYEGLVVPGRMDFGGDEPDAGAYLFEQRKPLPEPLAAIPCLRYGRVG